MPLFRNKSEAIIGLSLAELFMLSIALFWLVPSDSVKMVPETDLIKVQQELQEKTDAWQRAQAELEKLRGFAWLNDAKDSDLTSQELQKWVDEKLKSKKGGLDKPPCFDTSPLVEVSVIDGVTTVRLGDNVSPSALTELNENCVIALTAGMDCTAPNKQKALREAVLEYYKSHECRFYYRPSYKTQIDGYNATIGSPFRDYLYPLRERKIQ